MGDEAGSKQAAGVMAGKAALWTRPSIWKSAIVIAPLAATALFLASGTQAQTSASAAPPNQTTEATTVAAKPAPDAARRGRGPKSKTKEMTGRTASPTTTTDPATPTQTATPVAPIDAPAAARHRGPKGGGRDKILVGIAATPAPSDAPAEERRKERPKGDVGHGRTEATPAPDSAPVEERRKEGPKGAGESGRTEAPATTTPNPSGERAIRKNIVPKATSAKSPGSNLLLPILGGAAAIAAIVAATSGNDRPSSP